MKNELSVKIFDDLFLKEYGEDFKTLCKFNSNTPYQYLGWLNCAIKEHKCNLFKKIGFKIQFAVLYLNGEILGVAPIVIKLSGKKKGILFLGFDTASDYLDFVFSENITEKDVVYFVREILKATECDNFYFSGLRKESITYKALINEKSFCLSGEEACVSINTDFENYETYISSLKKSVRQNLRTAKNRMIKDEKNGELFIYKNDLDLKLVNELQALYEKRRKEQNKSRKSLSYKIYKAKRDITLKKYNYHSDSMMNNPDSVVLVYKIDGELAAFGHALRWKNGKLSFMQVSFSAKFGRYSPGLLMFTDYINKSMADGSNNTLDLTVGTEKYKYDLGGQEHFVVSGKFSLN